MGSDEGWSGALEENALLGRLRDAGAAESRTFWGYVGPSERDGWVTLHTSPARSSTACWAGCCRSR
jgi:hypothetical protein